MGIAERKERERQEMRQRIIEAAMQMFLTEGYEKTSIRNIADKIEYSPATIYLYYKDKDELLYDVQKEAFGKLDALFQQHVGEQDPFKRLQKICKTYVHFGIEHPELYDLCFIIRAPMNVVSEHEDKWTNSTHSFGFLVHCLTECIQQGCIKFDNVMLAAFSIWSMGHGLVSLDIRCRIKVMGLDDLSVAQLIDQSIDTYLEMIKK